MKTNNSSPSTRKKEKGLDHHLPGPSSVPPLAWGDTPSIHPTLDLSQFEISAEQALKWLDRHNKGEWKLPPAQVERYRAIVANDGKVDAVGRLAALGGRFCPVDGKAPLGFDWNERPYTEKEARAWGGNVGLLTGKASGGLVAIDIDSYGYNKFRAKFPGKAKTLTIGHKGAPDRAKLIFRIQGELPPNRKPKGLGLELFSTGLQVVVQGMHPDGHPYEVWNDSPIQTISSHTLDKLWHKATGKWLYPKAKKTRQPQVEPSNLPVGKVDYYANAAMKRELATLGATSQGDRNNQLFRSGRNLFEFVGANRLPQAVVEDALYNAAVAIGLDQDRAGTRGILATIQSAARKGMAKPRWEGLPAADEDLPDRVKGCGDIHPDKTCGKGKRYTNPDKKFTLSLIPWYCDDHRNCSSCARRLANRIRARLKQAQEEGKTVYFTFLTEREYRKLVRALGKESVIRIPQPNDEVVVMHTDPDRPGQPVNDRFLEDVYSYVRAIPEHKNVSGKLGAAARMAKSEDVEESATTMPVQLEWVKTDAPTDTEDAIYQETWARVEDRVMTQLQQIGGSLGIERAASFVMAEYRADLEKAEVKITASGSFYRHCDIVKVREWVSTYVKNHNPSELEATQEPGRQKQPA